MSLDFDLDFKDDGGGIPRSAGIVSVKFPFTIERYDREKFQREGHFVPRMVDTHGMPREWDGPLLFVGILHFELKDTFGTVTGKEQILRVLADTPQELVRLMNLRIPETLGALFAASHIQSSERDTVKRLNDENTILRSRLGEAK